ncbi:helix-turn-helix domain-containing protein [Paratissierella segnis]|jgi:DNA-binding XRE family transcriptional regulator|uniref:Helix-turn-helix transcriptional regulator n=1 Tax=Paratissierella segnis TaxID=2763679 RepID=A0A926EYR8_9FIRM|nr:helix-turn-helix transcriptional regulator [Paratissierella segnis]MBC8588859.1 helix-turn-helix transcriptional regulator [Paratissierella segnis]
MYDLWVYRVAGIVSILFFLVLAVAAVYLFILIIKALRKYVRSKDVREEKRVTLKSLSQVLRENRTRCKMTQEFVAETLGVSRQAVSKWENGTSDPSTSNLMALAKLYGISAEELIRETDSYSQQDKSGNASKEDGE